MTPKSIKKVRNLKGKRVLLRVDFNVPIKRGKVMDDTRLEAVLPTLTYLIEKKAKIIVATHVGRPKGAIVKELRVAPIAKRLGELLGKKVVVIDSKDWQISDKKKQNVFGAAAKLRGGQVAMIENVRFSPDEKKHSGALAADLSAMADIFVQDCFAVAHRKQASIVGPPEFLPSYTGFLLEQEIKGLDKVMKKPKKPFVAILGGAKVETKIPVMENLLPKVTHLLVGGGILNTYLWASGYKVGDSLIDKAFKKQALAFCKKRKVITPIDVVIGNMDGSAYAVVDVQKKPHQICKKGMAILDMGPRSVQLFATYIKEAQTLVWNGAMGMFEQKPYDIGTLAIARLVASRSKGKAFGVIGGGETLQSMDLVGMKDDIDLVSTGGGAMLEYLSGKELPGIAALK